MNTPSRPISFAALITSLAFGLFGLFPTSTSANHSWGPYHWNTGSESSPRLKLDVGNNLTSPWVTANPSDALHNFYAQTYLQNAWNNGCAGDVTGGAFDDCRGGTNNFNAAIASQVRVTLVSGATDARKCRPTTGRAEVCNASYGNNGWLGIAQIWTSDSHIAQGVMKLNDTYFNTNKYNTQAWRGMVMCQEIGHVFGLDHQDETFDNSNLGTCMDYTSNPTPIIANPDYPDNPWNVLPNYHDFEQLALIYGHAHETGSGGSGKGGKGRPGIPPAIYEDLNDRAQWGLLRRESKNGHTALYERELGGGHKLFTFVIWTK